MTKDAKQTTTWAGASRPGKVDKLAWLRENIDYSEHAPGAFYPRIFSDDRGSIRCK